MDLGLIAELVCVYMCACVGAPCEGESMHPPCSIDLPTLFERRGYFQGEGGVVLCLPLNEVGVADRRVMVCRSWCIVETVVNVQSPTLGG